MKKIFHDESVWVYRGYGHWEQFAVDSLEAVTYQKALDGMLPIWRERHEREFRAWFDKRQRMYAERELLDYRMVMFDEPVVDLYKVLSDEHRAWVMEAYCREEAICPEMVALSKIIPTQEEVNWELVKWYLRSGYTLDPYNRPPLALRFYGDEKVYLINGHHRYAAAKKRAHKAHHMMYVHVDSIDMSYEEACGKLEAFPVDVVDLFSVLLEGIA